MKNKRVMISLIGVFLLGSTAYAQALDSVETVVINEQDVPVFDLHEVREHLQTALDEAGEYSPDAEYAPLINEELFAIRYGGTVVYFEPAMEGESRQDADLPEGVVPIDCGFFMAKSVLRSDMYAAHPLMSEFENYRCLRYKLRDVAQ